jgi:large subunit ribosomal protein L20
MSRVTSAVASRKRRKRILKQARGYYGARSKNIRTVYDALEKAGQHSYTGRKQKKRQFRRLWTVRINAACRMNEINYSQFMHGLKLAGIDLNRKMLSEIAVSDSESFKGLVDTAKGQLSK